MVTKMGSLSHSVVFHVNDGKLLFRDEEDGTRGKIKGEGKEGWFCQRRGRRGVVAGGACMRVGLGLEGEDIASSWQDGLVMKGVDGERWGTDSNNAEKTRKKHKL
jgi:hypothetical protein